MSLSKPLLRKFAATLLALAAGQGLGIGSPQAFAKGSYPVQAEQRVYVNSCGYYSSVLADHRLTYRNDTLPWGTSVDLVYGYGGKSSNQPFHWEFGGEMAVPAVSPFVWSVDLSHVVQARSSPIFIDSLKFVLRVELPNGDVFYEKGSNSELGYYRARIGEGHCVGGEMNGLPPLQSVELEAVHQGKL